MKALHKPIHEKCIGCSMIVDIKDSGDSYKTCACYVNPSYWWRTSGGRKCPMATHLSDKINGIVKKGIKKPKPPIVPKSKNWPKSGIKTPKRFSFRKGRD